MPTQIGIGFSQKADSAEAAQEASVFVKAQMKNRPNLIIVFCTIHYDPKIFVSTIAEVLGKCRIVGSSCAGVILSNKMPKQGLAILGLNSEDILFETGAIAYDQSQDYPTAGVNLAKEIISAFGHHRRQALIAFTDGLSQNNSLIIRGMQEVIGRGFPIIGAGSCDDYRFQKSFLIFNERVLTQAVTGILLGGHLTISLGSEHGFRPLGKPRTIDEAQGHIIKTISGKKASHLYDEFLGGEAKTLQSSTLGQTAVLYPLGIYIEDEHQYLLRNALRILEDGSIVCQDVVPAGGEVHLMIGNRDSCKQAAQKAASQVKKALLGKQPQLILVFESLVRQKVLGRAACEEIKIIKNILGENVPLVGIYCYGEIAPFQSLENIQKIHFQNESIVILAIA